MATRRATPTGVLTVLATILVFCVGFLALGCKEGSSVMPVSSFLAGPSDLYGTSTGVVSTGTGTGTASGTSTGTGTVASVTSTITTSSSGSGYDLTGSVFESGTNPPVAVANAKVALEGVALSDSSSYSQNANSTTNGQYFMKNVPPGSYYLKISITDYIDYITHFDISSSSLPSALAIGLTPKKHSVSGRVTRAQSSTSTSIGLGGATVVVSRLTSSGGIDNGMASITVMTTTSGDFLIGGLRSGSYQAEASKSGTRSASANFIINADGTTVPTSLSLQLQAANFSYSGSVKDQNSLTPIPNAVVSLLTVTASQNTTSSGLPVVVAPATTPKVEATTLEGRFFFQGLSEGLYQLDATAASYTNVSYLVRILEDGTQSPQEPTIFLKQVASATIATITGNLVDAYSRAPLEYVTCTIAGFGNTLTDNHGNYTFSGIPPGDYKLKFEKNGYNTLEVNVTAKTTTSVRYDELIYSEEAGKGSISGRVIDETVASRPGVGGLIVRVYRLLNLESNADAPPAWTFEDATLAGAFDPNVPWVKSTHTNTDDPATIANEAGTFKITHLAPTDQRHRYYVYVGTQNSSVTAVQTVNSGYSVNVIDSNATTPFQRVFNDQTVVFRGWYGLTVLPNTTTYITNYDRESIRP